MSVKVLGPLETGTRALPPRERVILSVLIVRRGTTTSRAELADAYWGDEPPASWSQQIKTSIARIRERLGKESIATVGVDYRLGIDHDAIDAVRFEQLVTRAREHSLSETDRSIDAYRRALALWRGPAYPDLTDWEPGVTESRRLDEIRRSAEEELLEARLRAGQHREVVADAERLVREDPMREGRWAILAVADYQSGRQAEALAVLRQARTRLSDELGIEPGARLTELETAILKQDPSLTPAPPPERASTECPYRGLASFGPGDADEFFGRDADIEALRERTRPGAVVTVIGSSGSGKSSLVLAGLLPRLGDRAGAP